MKPFVRRIGTFLIVTLFISVMAETASAQFPRFNRRAFGTVPVENLARLEVVQESVGINNDQKKLIQEMNLKRNTETMELFQSANGDFEAIHKGVLKMNVEYFAKLKSVLDEKQQKRVTEIYYQVNNGMALVDEPVAKMLPKFERLDKGWKEQHFRIRKPGLDLSLSQTPRVGDELHDWLWATLRQGTDCRMLEKILPRLGEIHAAED